ncbi:MAG: GtrA family protein [Cyanobacteria bacterium P01_D01_bin.36]
MKTQSTLINRLKQLPIGRFLRFGVVGFSGLFVDIVVLFLLRERIGLPLYLSNNLAIEAAIINNFLWNDAWTFADVAQAQKGWGARLQRFAKFNVVCLVGAVLQNAILTLVLLIPAVGQLPSVVGGFVTAEWTQNANEYFAKVVAIALVTFWNFWLNLKVSWRSPKS